MKYGAASIAFSVTFLCFAFLLAEEKDWQGLSGEGQLSVSLSQADDIPQKVNRAEKKKKEKALKAAEAEVDPKHEESKDPNLFILLVRICFQLSCMI